MYLRMITILHGMYVCEIDIRLYFVEQNGNRAYKIPLLHAVFIDICCCLYLVVAQVDNYRNIWAAPSKNVLRGCTDSEGPDQTARMRSLIRAFAVRCQNHWILRNVSMESKGPDETLRMRRMMWIPIFCARSKALFACSGPFIKEARTSHNHIADKKSHSQNIQLNN